MKNSQAGGLAPAAHSLARLTRRVWAAAGDMETAFPVTAPGAAADVMKNSHRRRSGGRCPVPLKPANVAAWLAVPALADYQALLDDRERPFYA